MRGFCRQRSWDWQRRGHPVYVLERVRWSINPTMWMQAERRIAEAKRVSQGGSWDGKTGDGEAWSQRGPYRTTRGFFKRLIKGGRWAGPWRPDNAE